MYLQHIAVCVCAADSLKKKLSALPSPEREITTVNLKKDVKYGLGKGARTHFPKILHIFVSAPSFQLLELTKIVNNIQCN